MNESVLRVKRLRTDVSVVLENLYQLGTGSPMLVESQRYGLEAFSMLGKVLIFLGEPDPFDKGEPLSVPDWTTTKPKALDGIRISDLKVLRSNMQKIISSSTFNQLLNGFVGVGEPYVKYNQLDWHYTMNAMTSLLMMKAKLEGYMQTLYFKESKDERDARKLAERTGKPVKPIAIVVDATDDEKLGYLNGEKIPIAGSVPKPVLNDLYHAEIYAKAVKQERDQKAKELDAERDLKRDELEAERILKEKQRAEALREELKVKEGMLKEDTESARSSKNSSFYPGDSDAKTSEIK